jgi:tRNA(adenine34) deaminase
MERSDHDYMELALALAREAAAAGEIPVGALVVDRETGEILGTGRNRREQDGSPTAHAEILAIEETAKRRRSWRLSGCTLYVTLEPCPMCAGAIVQSRIKRVVYGASNPKAGCAGSVLNILDCSGFNHQVETTGGVLLEECAGLLREFFAELRLDKK